MKLLFEEEAAGCRCLYCDSPIYGRTDKKYCNASCKDKYNNIIKHRRNKMHMAVKKTLEKNYSILVKLLNADIKSARLDELDALGFNTLYCTYTIGLKNNRIFHCYDIQYQMSKNRIFNISYL